MSSDAFSWLENIHGVRTAGSTAHLTNYNKVFLCNTMYEFTRMKKKFITVEVALLNPLVHS